MQICVGLPVESSDATFDEIEADNSLLGDRHHLSSKVAWKKEGNLREMGDVATAESSSVAAADCRRSQR